jgi:hypothetical protein
MKPHLFKRNGYWMLRSLGVNLLLGRSPSEVWYVYASIMEYESR